LAALYIREHCPDQDIDYDGVTCDGGCLADDCDAAASDLDLANPS